MRRTTAQALAAGVAATMGLLAIYFGALTAISGWQFTFAEFLKFRWFVLALAAGFGLQVVLFMHLRAVVHQARGQGVALATSGTASAGAMVSCCAHYLANVAPVLGATGLVAFTAQYQVELFWVGLAFSAAGLAFIVSRIVQAKKEHAQCLALS
jgi:Cu+-exporting ATPase